MAKKQSKLSSILVLLVIAVVLVGGWTQRYNISDWWRLRDYTPPPEISQLATDTTMTDYGRRLFYVNQPLLNDKSSFQQNCAIDEVSIVLGCYVSSHGIYLYKVDDERLSGVHQVTAAHEMLHAAYERLSRSEKARIDQLTQEVFEATTDARLKATIASYQARDPNVVPNELHSILGTEAADLPSELEAYYQKYFSDRSKIVGYSKAYEGAFEERRNKLASYDSQLSTLRQRIDSGEAALTTKSAQISADRQALDALLAAEQVSQYNAAVPGFNASVRSYNNSVNEVRLLIDQYNKLVIERNAVAQEENELFKAIDSRPETLPAH